LEHTHPNWLHASLSFVTTAILVPPEPTTEKEWRSI